MALGADTHTNTHTHTDYPHKINLRNQVCAGLRPAHAWFKICRSSATIFIFAVTPKPYNFPMRHISNHFINSKEFNYAHFDDINVAIETQTIWVSNWSSQPIQLDYQCNSDVIMTNSLTETFKICSFSKF